MKLVIISPPESIQDETEIIVDFFENGMQHFHLRKPGFSEEEVDLYLKKLPEKYHTKIVLHSHHHLLDKYDLRGIHFTKKHFQWSSSRMRKLSNFLKPKGEDQTISASFHSLSEVLENIEIYNYLFLSPVFDSISKENYHGGFDLKEVKSLFDQIRNDQTKTAKAEIVSLGGIKPENIHLAFQAGFDGVAAFGSLWTHNDKAEILNMFKKLNHSCLSYAQSN
ncbi:MAG: thiamine phosphate synthase [Bacteroidota bacterium]|nr:thiamine phosphate synthase [Bacteroidota bacterium]